MAVTFISYGYDTLPGEGLSETVWQDMHPVIGLASYGVRSPADWKVTAVTGADRTVSIATGRGFGLGVIDKTFENDTIQLAAITSGSRWDLIACRRDPTPSAGVSKFVAVSGGTTPVIPGGRLSGPGIHDQPLALVQVTAGQTQPTGFIDLRTWAGDGGGLVAAHDLVRSYLNQTGTRLWINGVDWIRRAGVNDTPEWVKAGDSSVADVAWTNVPLAQGFDHFLGSGWSGLKYAVKNGWVMVDGAVQRGTPWPSDFTCAVIPSQYKPSVKIQGTGPGQIEPTVGNITLAAGSGSVSFSLTWPLF
jgi:hypothetical protein